MNNEKEQGQLEISFLDRSFSVNSSNRVRRLLNEQYSNWLTYFSSVGYQLDNIVRNYLNNIKSHADKIHDDYNFESVVEETNKFLAINRIVSSDITTFKLKGCSEQFVHSYLLGLASNNLTNAVRDHGPGFSACGFINGILDQYDFDGRIKEANSLIGEIKNSKLYIEESISRLKVFEDFVNQSNEKLNSLEKNYIENAEKAVGNINSNLGDLAKKTEENLRNMVAQAEKTALDQVKLQKSQELWNSKQLYHDTQEKRWFRILIGVVVVSCVLLFIGVYAADRFIPKTNKLIEPGNVAVVILLVIFFWFIRLVTKIWLSHSHLKNDAHERSVMTQTYLSLSLESSLSDEQRNIIFNSVFRPIKDGIVSDDGPNTPVLEIIDRLKAK